jgi:hypothetical protein
MSDLCGSSDNLISIVNYTLRNGLKDGKTTGVHSTSTDTNAILSNDSSSSPTKGSSSKNDNGSENDNQSEKHSEPVGNNKQTENEDKGQNVENDDTKDDEVDGANLQDDTIAPVSDLSDIHRRICVVTTAGLPWRYVNLPTRLNCPFCICI